MLDRENLEIFLEALVDKYTSAELVEILEDAELITVWDVVAAFEEQIIEGKEHFEV